MAFGDTLGQVLQNRPVLAYGASYLGGMIATASPCILASIPLIIGYVGGYAGDSRRQAFLYSLTFVVGLALVMSGLGAAAALMGTLFGDVGPYWYFLVSVILMVMGLRLAGVIRVGLGTGGQKFLPKKTGLWGALILGLLFGLVLSPCASPVLAVILALVAFQGKVLYGTTLLFTYALGQGTLIILAGTFTGVVNAYLMSRGAKAGMALQQLAGILIFFTGAYIFFQGFRGM